MQHVKTYIYILFVLSLSPLQSFADSICDNLTYHLPSGQWHQISLPCTPDNNDIASVLGDDIQGTLGQDWAIFAYIPQSNSYQTLTANDLLFQGKSYWLIQLSGADIVIDIQGTINTGTQSIQLDTQSEANTWNMIGYPFHGGQSWDSIRVITDTSDCSAGCTPEQAEQKQIVHDVIWHYNPVSEQYDSLTGAMDALLPWHGYWAATLAESHNTTPQLTVTIGQNEVSLDSWRELDLSFNGIGVGVDSSNKLLFLSLPTGFAALQNYTATLQYGLETQGFSLRINNGSPLASGNPYNFGNIQYGSMIPVQLYQNGSFSDDYSLIFSNLPVIELAADDIVDEPKKPGTFQLFSGEFDQATDNMNMGIEFRGATSQAFPKKSFSLELVKADDPQDELKIKLLNLRKDGDWILDASYRDTTFVRNLVSHDIYRTIMPFAHTNANGKEKGQSTIAGQLVEVILNEAYHGVYVLEEKIDRKLLGLKKIKPPTDASGNDLWQQVDFSVAKNGSVLYKASSNDADLYDYQPSDLHHDFEQKYPKLTDVAHWQPLEELADFINNASDSDFINDIDNRVNIDSAVDYWILTLLSANKDTLKKNYYLARNEFDPFFIVPWDYDATFGILWNGSKYSRSTWWDPNKNKLISRLSQLTATGFNSKVKVRWNALRDSTLTETALIARFQSYIDQLQPVAGNLENPRVRNLDRWPDSGGSGVNNPELGTMPYIDNWIHNRLIFLDDKINAQPV